MLKVNWQLKFVVNPVVYVNTTSTIKITILDEQGNQVELLQNQLLTIEFRNKWFIAPSRHQCKNSNSSNTLFLKLITFDQITLNSDGKYYYNFIQNKMEDITIIVSINTQGYTYTEYYNDQYLLQNFAFGK